MKTTLYFLNCFNFINTGKHRKVLCTNLSANINKCFFELEEVLIKVTSCMLLNRAANHRKRDIISTRVHGARCTSNAGV